MAVRQISERVQRIHKEAIVIDMLQALIPFEKTKKGYFKKVREAGVTGIHCTYVHPGYELLAYMEATGQLFKMVEEDGNTEIVTHATDVERIKREGKLAYLGLRLNAGAFERDLNLLRVFYKLGARVAQIAYLRQNLLGSGCEEPVDHGLSERGREAVKEMNRLGILIDISHVGDKTAMEAALLSKDPICATHTTPAGLVDMPRARADEVVKVIAERGGVVAQNMEAPFNERRGREGIRPALRDYVEMIDYWANLVGIDHVGLGTDVMPCWSREDYEVFTRGYGALIGSHKHPRWEDVYCEGYRDVSDTIKITEEFVQLGYSDDDIKKVLGGNWLRLIGQVWK